MRKDLYINFLPLHSGDISVTCYRCHCSNGSEAKPDNEHYRFSEDRLNVNAQKWWFVCDEREGYEEYSFIANKEPMAARWIMSRRILRELERSIASAGDYKAVYEEGFYPKLIVKVRERKGFGWQGFILEFDWHSELRRHGLYVNYHFFKDELVPFDDTIQKLSFSLNESGRPNCNFFRAQYDWIRTFYVRFLEGKTWCFNPHGGDVSFDDVALLPATVLCGKVFEFANGETNRSPYWGLKKAGPYQGCPEEPTYFFVFQDGYRQTARFLYECLIGREFPERFPGMQKFFGVQFGNANVRHVLLKGTDVNGFKSAADEIVSSGCANPVAIVLVSGDAHEYLTQKSTFLAKGIPSQDITIDKARAGRNFQWSVAGVALQLFCKSRGLPWCVKTPRKRDLIIGISQLWTKKDRKRYVAYSVTTDASGLFRDIRTLSDKTEESDYIAELGRQIKSQLQAHIDEDHPDRIVLHCSFRLLKSAMQSIRSVTKEVLRENSNAVQIIIIRVNDDHHYQGFDLSRETMVPDENTVLKVGNNAFLAWPDGTPQGGVIRTRPSDPIYVVFDRADPPITDAMKRDMLQDLCNLSGANWRGFNAKARPVSVFYCHLVGRMMADMDELGLELPAIEKFIPWFL